MKPTDFETAKPEEMREALADVHTDLVWVSEVLSVHKYDVSRLADRVEQLMQRIESLPIWQAPPHDDCSLAKSSIENELANRIESA